MYFKNLDRFLKICISVPVVDSVVYKLFNIYSRLKIDSSISNIPNNDLSRSSESKWIIQTSVPRKFQYKSWGDFHFGQELVASLIKKGIDARFAFRTDRYNLGKNDVVIVLRGIVPFKSPKNNNSVLWVISHPDQISKREVKKFSHSYAASTSWAAKKNKEWATRIKVLEQATNLRSPHDLDSSIELKDLGVFVGNSINRHRKIVDDALGQGLNFKVFGRGWENQVPREMIASEYIEYMKLPMIYGTAKFVLVDHWGDMAKNGFVSNKVLDVIASGGVAVSDHVMESPEIVRKLSIEYMEANDLRLQTSDDQIEKLRKVLRESNNLEAFKSAYSFDNRATQLIKDILG